MWLKLVFQVYIKLYFKLFTSLLNFQALRIWSTNQSIVLFFTRQCAIYVRIYLPKVLFKKLSLIHWFILMGGRKLPAVTALSDSDGELDESARGLAPVSLLSDSDVDSHEAESICLEEPKRGRKRKRNASKPPLAERLKSTDNLEKLVSRPCKRCVHGCLKKFRFVSKFKELTAYREHWCDLHKIDQDQLVACPLLAKQTQKSIACMTPPLKSRFRSKNKLPCF